MAERELTNFQTAALLQVGLRGASRPIDDMLDRVNEPGGGAWYDAAVRDRLGTETVQALRDGNCDKAIILDTKAHAKQGSMNAASQDESLQALAVYCLAVAAGLVHLDQLFSSQRPMQWADVLSELAGSADPDWREFFSSAAEAALRMTASY